MSTKTSPNRRRIGDDNILSSTVAKRVDILYQTSSKRRKTSLNRRFTLSKNTYSQWRPNVAKSSTFRRRFVATSNSLYNRRRASILGQILLVKIVDHVFIMKFCKNYNCGTSTLRENRRESTSGYLSLFFNYILEYWSIVDDRRRSSKIVADCELPSKSLTIIQYHLGPSTIVDVRRRSSTMI